MTRRRRYPSATVRDWSLTAFALTETRKNLRGTGLKALAVVTVGGVMLALSAYAILVLAWPYLLGFSALWLALRLWRWQRARSRPVPWDDDYRESQDDDIPY